MSGASSSKPTVTVVVPTRDRGDQVATTLRRVLEIDEPSFAVRVVDQSADDATEEAVAKLGADPRLHYQRSTSEGISASLNRGIAAATSEFIAITGDDCEPAADWLREMLAPFALDPRIAVVFGNVVAGEHDESAGFVTGYEHAEVVHARSIHDQHLVGGTSACMALRRSVWESLGGFDELLGVGASLQAGEDLDFTIRALLDGHHVYETPSAAVVHRGFFRWDERETVIGRNWFGTGAAFAKSLRRGRPSALLNLPRLAWRWATVGRSPVAKTLGTKPLRRSLIAGAFARGFLAGIAVPVERSGHYRRKPGG